MSPAKKSQKKPRPVPKPVIRRFDFPNPPPPLLPQSADGFDHKFGPYRLDRWINKYIDELHPRQRITGDQIDVGPGEVLVLLQRVYRCPLPYMNKGFAEPFARDLTCYLYATAVLADHCNMGSLKNTSPGPLQIGEADARTGAYFHPTDSPRWTTADDWRPDDTLTIILPRNELYSLLLQAVHREFRNNQVEDLPEKMFHWLNRLVEIYPSDAPYREAARRWLLDGHPMMVLPHLA